MQSEPDAPLPVARPRSNNRVEAIANLDLLVRRRSAKKSAITDQSSPPRRRPRELGKPAFAVGDNSMRGSLRFVSEYHTLEKLEIGVGHHSRGFEILRQSAVESFGGFNDASLAHTSRIYRPQCSTRWAISFFVARIFSHRSDAAESVTQLKAREYWLNLLDETLSHSPARFAHAEDRRKECRPEMGRSGGDEWRPCRCRILPATKVRKAIFAFTDPPALQEFHPDRFR